MVLFIYFNENAIFMLQFVVIAIVAAAAVFQINLLVNEKRIERSNEPYRFIN